MAYEDDSDMILLTESEEVIRLLPERHVLSDRSM